MRSLLDWILVGRLKAAYWGPLVQSWTEKRVREAQPQPLYADPGSSTREAAAWDLGRVHHFLQLVEDGGQLDPIVIDNHYDRNGWGPPFIVDGHHRFVASVLARRRRILASCSGLVSSSEWLAGWRRRRPQELL